MAPNETLATAPGARAPGRRSCWTKLGLAALALAAALGTAEVVLRVRGSYRAAEAERELESLLARMLPTRTQGQARDETVEDASPGLGLHPYLGYDWAENNAVIGREVEYFRSEESRRTYDILLAGGSVAGSFGTSGASELIARLAADPLFRDRPVRVLSHGRGGYKQPQPLLLVAYLLALGYQPDAVLEIDGFNDCALANANLAQGIHPAHPSASHWAHLASGQQSDREALDLLFAMRARQREAAAWLERARRFHLTDSALLGTLVTARLRTLRKQYVAAGARYVKHVTDAPGPAVTGPPVPAGVEAAREAVLAAWFESSRSLDALCRARSILYLHVLQPTLHDAGSKPLTEEERANGTCGEDWIEGVRYGYPRMRELGAELGALGIAFVDGSRAFQDVGETLYYDPCHFDPRGNELLARLVAEALLERLRAAR